MKKIVSLKIISASQSGRPSVPKTAIIGQYHSEVFQALNGDAVITSTEFYTFLQVSMTLTYFQGDGKGLKQNKTTTTILSFSVSWLPVSEWRSTAFTLRDAVSGPWLSAVPFGHDSRLNDWIHWVTRELITTHPVKNRKLGFPWSSFIKQTQSGINNLNINQPPIYQPLFPPLPEARPI